LEGTPVVPLFGEPRIKPSEQEQWVEIKLADGRTLTATPKHPVYSDAGKTPLQLISCGEEIITDKGMVVVVEKRTIQNKATKLAVYLPTGHLYWANGILSHNYKEL
jgi:intein/homing endonuclease